MMLPQRSAAEASPPSPRGITQRDEHMAVAGCSALTREGSMGWLAGAPSSRVSQPTAAGSAAVRLLSGRTVLARRRQQ